MAMHQFQLISMHMVDIAQQSIQFRKALAIKWFSSMLDEDDKPMVRSAFRSQAARGFDPRKRPVLSEAKINKDISKLAVFIANRKFQRQALIS